MDWTCIAIDTIDALRDAVLGAGLNAVQMSKGRIGGNLAFAELDGIVYSSGSIDGRVALTGPLSESEITIGLGLHIAPGSWHWFKEVRTGSLGIFMPGDEHESLYEPGALYLTATLSLERLEEIAAQDDLIVDLRSLGGTGFHPHIVPLKTVDPLRRMLDYVHRSDKGTSTGPRIATGFLGIAVGQFGRQPRLVVGRGRLRGQARVVAKAKSYIEDNLQNPILIDQLAAAADTSRRTLFRAFMNVLGESPQAYIQRLRLHRIRNDLASETETKCTVTMVAHSWCMTQLGRLSGQYREMFGELPSETISQIRGPDRYTSGYRSKMALSE